MEKQIVAPGQKEHDIEVTDERLAYMKSLLLRLYADQIGMEVVSAEVHPATKGDTV